MMRALSLVILLAGYWALLSGQFHNNFLIACGVVCIAFVVWMASRMGLVDDEGAPRATTSGCCCTSPTSFGRSSSPTGTC
ncbi:hypothetical protein [Nannocystis pusilla]|uniref:hypothetical protein n=1 Tax=Nannocystis pusilla TaxID=889268 RepID=UPI003B7EF95D